MNVARIPLRGLTNVKDVYFIRLQPLAKLMNTHLQQLLQRRPDVFHALIPQASHPARGHSRWAAIAPSRPTDRSGRQWWPASRLGAWREGIMRATIMRL